MTQSAHERAQELITLGQSLLHAQQTWLRAHLQACPDCRDYAEAHALKDFEGKKSAVLPSAQPQRLGCQEHVLADCRRLAKDVVAGLPLDDR